MHHSNAYRLTLEKVGYPYLIFCCCIHLQALAAVKHMIMMSLVNSWMVMFAMIMFAMVTGLTKQKMSHKILSKFAKYKTIF